MKALEYLLSQPLLVTPEALQSALAVVDRVRESEVEVEAVESRRGLKIDGAEAGMVRRDGVAVIPICGPIYRYADWLVAMCGGATVEEIARDLRLALDDPSVRSILLSIDSPGGEAAGIGELAGMIRAANATKPVCAYVSNQGCSAAYWLASAAGEIVAAPAAMLGSIGVVMGYTKRDDRPGTKTYEFVSSQSPNKRPDMETEKGRAEVQRIVDDLAEVFIASVAENRGTTSDQVASTFGRGGVLIGAKAVEVGMADRLGTFEGVLLEMTQPSYGKAKPNTTAAASLPTKGQSMFNFLFRPKADGSGIEFVPQASEGTGTEPKRPASPPTQPSSSDQATAEAYRQLAEARQQLALAQVETINARAEGLYNTLFAANLIVPAERKHLTELFAQASMDDLANPLKDGKTRASLVEGLYKARTAHTLDREQLGTDGAIDAATGLPRGYKTLGARSGEQETAPSPARLRELMGHLVNAGQLSADALPK